MKNLGAVILIFIFSACCHAASFDCGISNLKPVEKMICSSAETSALDDQYSAAHKKALERASDKNEFRQRGKSWILIRNACVDTACLVALYKSRIQELNDEDTENVSNEGNSRELESKLNCGNLGEVADQAQALPPDQRHKIQEMVNIRAAFCGEDASEARRLRINSIKTQQGLIQKRLMLETDINDCSSEIAVAQKEVERQRKIAKESGVENKGALYEAGKTIVDCKEQIPVAYKTYRDIGGAKSLVEIEQAAEIKPTGAEQALLSHSAEEQVQHEDDVDFLRRAQMPHKPGQ